MNIFCTVRQKKVKRKSWYIPKMPKKFWNPKKVKHQLVPPPNVSATWVKKQFPHNRDTPNIQKILIPERFWNTEGFSYQIFWYCETKKFQQKIVINPSYAWIFSIPENSETLKGYPTKSLCTVRQKAKKTVILLLSKKKQKSSGNTEGFPHELFLVLWDKNISTENHGTPNIHKIFDIRTVLKHIRVPLQTFGTARQNSFNTKSWYTPFMLNFCRYPKISETMKGSPTKGFCTVRKKINKTVILLLSKKSWHQNAHETQNGTPMDIFGTVKQKLSTEKRDIPLLCLKFLET